MRSSRPHVLPTSLLTRPLLGGLLAFSLMGTLALATPATAWAKQEESKPASDTKPADSQKQSETTPKPLLLNDTALAAIETAAQNLDPETRNSINKLAESMQWEDRSIYNELRDDEEVSLSDVGMLWQAAVERSGTIRYAIEKLSRRDATGKPVESDSFSKRLVQNMVHLTGVASTMWSGTPAGLIGSNMVQDIISGSPDESPLMRVTDTDMVILAKDVEALQSKLLDLYYNYRHAQERLELAEEASLTIGRYYDHALDMEAGSMPSEALQPLMQSIYESARQEESNAQQAYQSARTELSLLVGIDAVAALEQRKADNTKAAQ